MNKNLRFFILILFSLPIFFQNCGPMHSIEQGNSQMGTSVPTIQNTKGEALYQANCVSCHGVVPDSRTFGADFTHIQSAIAIVPQMSRISLDNSDIQSIADYLQELANPNPIANGNNPGGSTGSGNTGGGSTGGGNPMPNPNYQAPSPAPLQNANAFGVSGTQRLTKHQLALTLEQNLGVNLGSLKDQIPSNSGSSTFFENDYEMLSVSFQNTLDYSNLAESVSKVYSAARFQQDIGCTPNTNDDRACFGSFLSKMGRRFFRRPLTTGEVDKYSDLLLDYARDENRFMTAVEMALEAFIQHPEFLYRIEESTSQAAPIGLTRINPYAVATRLAFLITGKGPSDSLLDSAAAGQLNTAQGRAVITDQLLKTAAAIENINHFHAQWLGYGELLFTHVLKDHFAIETDQLIEKIVFTDNSDWLNIFTSDQTFLTPQLANHYGIGGVSQSRWIATTGRRKSGILSHARFAAVGSKFGDTSPTLRGYEIFKRVFCGKLTGNIPPGVDTTVAPGNPNDCKPDRYPMRDIQSCAGCHSATDGIGFGLEGIDQFGRLRDVEVGNNQCNIDNKGDYKGTAFDGPAGLAQIIDGNPHVGACATKNMFEFMMGRPATNDDENTLKALEGEYYQTRSLQGILKAIATSEAMVHKKD